MPNPLGVPAQAALKPSDDVLGVGHAAAEHQELCLGWRHGDGQLVVETAIGVAEHLVLVDHQKPRAVAIDEAVFLRLKRGNDDRRVQVFRKVTRGDTNIPAARAPLGELVVSQSASRHGVNRLAGVAALVGPKLKNERFACAGRRVDDNILASPQMLNRLLLPQVWNDELIQGRKTIQLRPELLHGAKLAKNREKNE